MREEKSEREREKWEELERERTPISGELYIPTATVAEALATPSKATRTPPTVLRSLTKLGLHQMMSDNTAATYVKKSVISSESPTFFLFHKKTCRHARVSRYFLLCLFGRFRLGLLQGEEKDIQRQLGAFPSKFHELQ